MAVDDFALYQLRFGQMDAVRAAHRDSRRFHATLNISGMSTLLGLYGQFGQSGVALVGAAAFGLMLMSAVWYANAAYAAKQMAIRGRSVLDLEGRLGLGFFRDELVALHGSAATPQFRYDRFFAVLLASAYALIASLCAWQSGLAGALPGFVQGWIG